MSVSIGDLERLWAYQTAYQIALNEIRVQIQAMRAVRSASAALHITPSARSTTHHHSCDCDLIDVRCKA
jgi:hypothetical protein